MSDSKLAHLTTEDLHGLAQAAEIEGRSTMHKDELVAALDKAGVGLEALSKDQLVRVAEGEGVAAKSSMNKGQLADAINAGPVAQPDPDVPVNEVEIVDGSGEHPGIVPDVELPAEITHPEPETVEVEQAPAVDAHTPAGEPPIVVQPEPVASALVRAVSDSAEQPLQEFGADDRLGGAPPEAEAPVGVHYNPDANIAEAGWDDSGETYEGYVPPFRPIPVTAIAGYPTSNTE